jgi:hypothetical protein
MTKLHGKAGRLTYAETGWKPILHWSADDYRI